MQENKVISSNIQRAQKPLQNNLYDLITVATAKPIEVKKEKEHICDFQPVTGKVYIPKKRIRHSKVKTVRDIRILFESDVSTDLSKDLEKQQNILLKKITSGSSREENTKAIARNILKCGKPVSRSAWQMLMNVNPEGKPHSIQYVLWNGRRIRVNGSKGGKNTFLCNYDLANVKVPVQKENKCKTTQKKKGLLKNSLTVKFKPGPLTRKTFLDDSHQKYNVGKTELVNIPKSGLDIQPTYGVPMEPTIANFVQSLRDADGTISKKWANFAVSVLGTVKNSEAVQNNEESGVTFELKYKLDQRRMLMRRDVGKFKCCSWGATNPANTAAVGTENSDETVHSEVENVLKDMLASVEISLQQDSMFTYDEPREEAHEEGINLNISKEKTKKRYCELDRLDVTVIRLPDVPEDDISKKCNNLHCSLGCVCASLQRSYHLKQHCGRSECMFECKCDFSRYKATDVYANDCSELIPGLINLDNELSSKLAKEEQKFHQTVVVTGEKSILLKAERRNWKATKRYGNFYDTMCLKNESDTKNRRILSIVDVKLNWENVEPWCMVHNLYKCYCKGIFTQKTINTNQDEVHETVSHDGDLVSKNAIAPGVEDKNLFCSDTSYSNKHVDSEVIDLDYLVNSEYTTCARSRPYKGRKYKDAHYVKTHKRILQMEENDDHLRKRMLSILNISDDSDRSSKLSTAVESENLVLRGPSSIESNDKKSDSENASKDITTSDENSCNDSAKSNTLFQIPTGKEVSSDKSILYNTTNKTKLIAWLESSYKQYKRRIDQGIVKKSLDPPNLGKVALYPWEFILSRYRERKNLFLISTQKPFRIFMAVDAKNSFFANCINIDDIRFADLHQYPVTVTNLLTNATNLKDNFCILCGLSHCWELIGSVTKLDDQTSDTDQLQSVADDKMIGFVAQDEDQDILDEPRVTETVEANPVLSVSENATNINDTENITKSSGHSKIQRKGRALKSKKLEIIEKGSMSSKDSTKSTDKKVYHDVREANNVKSNMEVLVETTENSSKDEEQNSHENDTEMNIQSSKWFVMTVENDFSEIQFYKRGFFVKYESIIKAINVARMSGKTVRLSSQKGADQSSGPQFGIYAIPNSNEYYVFIGPYDKDEPLGIETVKSFSDIKKTKRTKGVWITTQKIDNLKVIDNPLSFMPTNLRDGKIVSLENEAIAMQFTKSDNAPDGTDSTTLLETIPPKQSPIKDQYKIVKPIKIRKSNGFYQLAPRGFLTHVLPKPNEVRSENLGTASNRKLQSILLPKQTADSNRMSVLTLPGLYYKKTPQNSQTLFKKTLINDDTPNTKPVAEIAPQIKIVDVYSETKQQNRNISDAKKTDQGSMFILKPEEINKRIMENTLTSNSVHRFNKVSGPKREGDANQEEGGDINQDIENFLATSDVYVPPNAYIFEISDEDDAQDIAASNNWQNVWIECETACLGYIRGRKNAKNMISFEFPGFKFTDFYPEEEAFSKINQVISRKIYVPKSISLTWRVCDSISDVTRKFEIKTDCLGPDFVLTKRGVRHKQDLIFGGKTLLKASEESAPATITSTSRPTSNMSLEEVDSAIDILSGLEDKSKQLEDESDKLMSQISKLTPVSLFKSLSTSANTTHIEEQREQLSKALQDISSDNT